MLTFFVIAVVRTALIIGVTWGIYRVLSEKTVGFLVALAGGSLLAARKRSR